MILHKLTFYSIPRAHIPLKWVGCNPLIPHLCVIYPMEIYFSHAPLNPSDVLGPYTLLPNYDLGL